VLDKCPMLRLNREASHGFGPRNVRTSLFMQPSQTCLPPVWDASQPNQAVGRTQTKTAEILRLVAEPDSRAGVAQAPAPPIRDGFRRVIRRRDLGLMTTWSEGILAGRSALGSGTFHRAPA